MGYYIDQEIRFDTKTCYLGRPSNEVVQKVTRLASLTADASAPTELSLEQKSDLAIHPEVVKLSQRNKTTTQEIHRVGFKNITYARGTTLFRKKKKAEAHLNRTKKRLRDKMIEQAWKRHFRTADTQAFDAQFSATAASKISIRTTQLAKPIFCNIPERAAVVQLVCRHTGSLSDNAQFRRRIQTIEAQTALCRRREAQRRGRPKITTEREESISPVNDCHTNTEAFPLVCRRTQCLFCLINESLPYHYRVFEFAKPRQMMNEVDKHLNGYAPADQIPCPHPQCKVAGLILSNVMHFKNHTATVHKILLRG